MMHISAQTEQEVQQLVHEEVGDDEEGQQVCPICLDTPDLAEAAAVHGCGHTYCGMALLVLGWLLTKATSDPALTTIPCFILHTVTCILRWASCKDKGATCPQCKSSFTHVVTHRKPSGTLQDFASNVSVAELLDSCWFAYHKRVCVGHWMWAARNSTQQWFAFGDMMSTFLASSPSTHTANGQGQSTCDAS